VNPGARQSMIISPSMIEGHERTILAYLMTEPGGCDKFLHKVLPEFFFVPAHRKIFDAIHDVCDEREKVNHLTVADRLREKGELDWCGGVPRIIEISNETTSAEIANYALGCMLDAYREREAAQICKLGAVGKITAAEVREKLDKILSEAPVTGVETNWLATIDKAIVTSSELRQLTLKSRRKLLGDWFCEGDLGFIFASRGVGKTWLALAIAQALSTGGKLGEWTAHAFVKVLYIDGEMPPDLMRSRCEGLDASNDNLQSLNHEILFDRTGKVLNITNREIQEAITQRCLASAVKVLILDNLSTLASGMRENEADSWELVNNWLLDLRRRKIAVVIVHHAGRSGEMRGTSKREDNVFWILALDDAKKDADDKRGARFISRFTKPSRNTQEEVPAYEWHFVTDEPTGVVSIGYKLAQTMDVFLGLIEDGVTECGQIAQEMKTSPATISRLAKRAIDAGKIIKKSREYFLAEGQKADKKP
jgi:AAA domain-containing protein/DnaB helicase-like protein